MVQNRNTTNRYALEEHGAPLMAKSVAARRPPAASLIPANRPFIGVPDERHFIKDKREPSHRFVNGSLPGQEACALNCTLETTEHPDTTHAVIVRTSHTADTRLSHSAQPHAVSHRADWHARCTPCCMAAAKGVQTSVIQEACQHSASTRHVPPDSSRYLCHYHPGSFEHRQACRGSRFWISRLLKYPTNSEHCTLDKPLVCQHGVTHGMRLSRYFNSLPGFSPRSPSRTTSRQNTQAHPRLPSRRTGWRGSPLC